MLHLLVYPALSDRFDVSFDEFAGMVSGWEGMFFEMDGSFVWVENDAPEKGQMDGMVYDREGSIVYLDLKGAAPAAMWTRILKLLLRFEHQVSSQELESHLKIYDVQQSSFVSLTQTI